MSPRTPGSRPRCNQMCRGSRPSICLFRRFREGSDGFNQGHEDQHRRITRHPGDTRRPEGPAVPLRRPDDKLGLQRAGQRRAATLGAERRPAGLAAWWLRGGTCLPGSGHPVGAPPGARNRGLAPHLVRIAGLWSPKAAGTTSSDHKTGRRAGPERPAEPAGSWAALLGDPYMQGARDRNWAKLSPSRPSILGCGIGSRLTAAASSLTERTFSASATGS